MRRRRPSITRRRPRQSRRARAPRRSLSHRMSLGPMHGRYILPIFVVGSHTAIGIARRRGLQRIIKEGVDALAEVFGLVLAWCQSAAIRMRV